MFGDIAIAPELGIHVPEGTTADFAAVMERMRRIRTKVSHHDSVKRYSEMGIDLYLGEGKFTSGSTIEVGGQTLEFAKAVIATGARAAAIPIPGLQEAGYLTNENIWELTELPERMAVIGGGPIGSELAQTFQRLGSDVALFDVSPQILSREDPDAARIVQDQLVDDGLTLYLQAGINSVSRDGEAKVISFTHEGQEKTAVFDHILLAVGRKPNVDSLNLEVANVKYHKRGVEINDYMQTSNPNIYAIGDVAVPYQFTHVADATARIAVQNALFFGRQKFSNLVVPWVTYTDPEVAHVGMYEKDAKEKGIAIDTYTVYLNEMDRGLADGEEGFVRIHTEKGSDKIVGGTIVARHAGEMLGEITLAMTAKIGLKTLASTIHPYPTQSEAIKKIADTYNRTRLTPTIKNFLTRILSWRR